MTRKRLYNVHEKTVHNLQYPTRSELYKPLTTRKRKGKRMEDKKANHAPLRGEPLSERGKTFREVNGKRTEDKKAIHASLRGEPLNERGKTFREVRKKKQHTMATPTKV